MNSQLETEAMHPSIDIIIPTYKRNSRINTLIPLLVQQLTPDDKIYIVWQGKYKPSIETSKHVELVFSGPPSLPRARNRGTGQGKNEIILFLDDDVKPIDGLLEEHRKSYSDQSIGCVAGYIEDPRFDKSRTIPSYFDEKTGELIQNFSYSKSCYTISAMGANMSFKRKALNSVGGFDEQYQQNALWEEIDCTFRIRRAGYNIFYNSDAKVVHLCDNKGGCHNLKKTPYLFFNFSNTAYFASRFAPPHFYGQWYRFWKYRLEYLSRKKFLWMSHDPVAVLVGFTGAFWGIARHLCFGRKKPFNGKSK